MANPPNPNPATVIAISGPRGVGKSLLCKNIATALPNAVAIHFDDYTNADTYPSDLSAWAGAGYDVNQIKSPQFARDLILLRSGQSIIHPIANQTIPPAAVVIAEEPCSRERTETAGSIDFVVYIDLPPDIALLRSIKRILAHQKTGRQSPAQICASISEMLDSYQSITRGAYALQNDSHAKKADLRLDGMKSPEDMLRQFLGWWAQRR